MKYFLMILWCFLASFTNSITVPQNYQYLFGFFAGGIALTILQVFDRN